MYIDVTNILILLSCSSVSSGRLSGSGNSGGLVSGSQSSKSQQKSRDGKSENDGVGDVENVVVSAPDAVIVSVLVSVDGRSSDKSVVVASSSAAESAS